MGGVRGVDEALGGEQEQGRFGTPIQLAPDTLDLQRLVPIRPRIDQDRSPLVEDQDRIRIVMDAGQPDDAHGGRSCTAGINPRADHSVVIK